jgi:hypothetical protein
VVRNSPCRIGKNKHHEEDYPGCGFLAARHVGVRSATLSTNDDAKSNGSSIGQQSSQVKGNGDWVGGNGTSGPDQTTSPGSRADAVHGSNTGKPGQANK